MKILHIITSLKIGGAESALYNLLEQLSQDKHDTHYVVYFYDGPNVEKINNLGVQVFQIKGLFFKYDPIAYLQLKRLVKKLKPDVIHSALWAANFLGRVISKKLKIPIVCDLHSNFTYDGKLRAWLDRLTVLSADKYVAVSSSAKQGFIKSVVEKINDKKNQEQLTPKITMIKNGIDVEKVISCAFRQPLLRSELGFSQSDFIVGTVGRLDPIKSYELLIKSFYVIVKKIQMEKAGDIWSGNLRSLKLCFVGDGPSRGKLERLVAQLELGDKVFFMGQRTDACRFYPIFDCFVLSSISEGLSISLLEAFCFGLPVVTTNQGGKFHDVIKDGENGFLVPVADKLKLAQAIEKLFLNPALLLKMKKANLRLVKSKFEITRVAGCYRELYKRLR